MGWTTWNCSTPTVSASDTATKSERNGTAPRQRCFEGSNRMCREAHREAHVRFQGSEKSAMASCYPTRGHVIEEVTMLSDTVPLVVATSILLFADAAQDRETQFRKDVEALQGVWAIVKVESEGKDVTQQLNIKDLKLRVTRDKLIPISDGKEEAENELSYTIDPTIKPKTMDLINGHTKTTAKAIYSLEEGQLKVAFWFVLFGREPEGRPTSFDTKPHKHLLCLVLKKAEK